MLWLTWRQHRAELFVAGLLLASVAVSLIITGLAMHHEYDAQGAAACIAEPANAGGCAQIIDQFLSRYTEWGNRLVWVAFLPALAGVFIGAPLLAREFELGTWRLAFTQSVTRARWVGVKLTVVGAALAVVAITFGTLFTWWRAPLNAIDGRLRTASFIVAAPSLTSVTLFAFGVGALAGVLLRRTIPAMAATLAAYIAVRVPMEEYVRPLYQAPRVKVTAAVDESTVLWRPDTDWIVNDGWIDAAGQRISDGQQTAIVREIYEAASVPEGSGHLIDRYLIEHGIRLYTEYHSDSDFWTFQAIESIVFLGGAALLLATTVWIVRRRTT